MVGDRDGDLEAAGTLRKARGGPKDADVSSLSRRHGRAAVAAITRDRPDATAGSAAQLGGERNVVVSMSC